MASTHALWQDYFDNPTLSDLTIQLSDRVVHAHRIVLCRGSEYFAKLLTGSFKESGSNEIELHEDESVAAVAMLRYIYGLDHDKTHVDAMGERQFLAATFVTATKYQLDGLDSKTYDQMRKLVTTKKLHPGDMGPIDDMLNAITTTITSTSRQDCRMRKLMVDYCFWNLPALSRRAARFSDLLADHTELSAEMITRFGSAYSPFEGSWYCGDHWHPDVEPSCYNCEGSYSKHFMLSHRGEKSWNCPNCEVHAVPHCWAGKCPNPIDEGSSVEWVWDRRDHRN